MQKVPRHELHLHGRFRAVLDGRPVAFPRHSAAHLLAYLALAGNETRARVAASLWPQVEQERALTSLRQSIRAVATAAGPGWILADRTHLGLDPSVTLVAGDGRLLDEWDEPWLDRYRPRVEIRVAPSPPVDALFDLLRWYDERSEGSAVRLAMESLSVLEAAPAARVASEVGSLLERLHPLPKGSEPLQFLVGRSQYLMGDMEGAYATFQRLAEEGAEEERAAARLSQVVVLRETGAPRAAAELARRTLAHPAASHLRQMAAYHAGLSMHFADESDGLALARAAVEAGLEDPTPLARLFPTLNVAEGLFDRGEPAAETFLNEARHLAEQSGDSLGLLSVAMLDALRLGSTSALKALRRLEQRAWAEGFRPFAAGVADRAALLAYQAGQPQEAARLLARSDRIRRRLGLRRNRLERQRLKGIGE